jgi:hypothetical protein
MKKKIKLPPSSILENTDADVKRNFGGQSKRHSIFEALSNVLIGYTIAVSTQIVLFPFFDIHISVADDMKIGLWFTVVSLIRSYLLRRF